MIDSNDVSESWKDRYHELVIDRNQLAKKLNETETTVRLLKTKQTKLDALINKQTIETRRPSTAFGSLRYSERQELEELLEDTQKKYAKSLKNIRGLEMKQKESLEIIEKNKREISSLRRRLTAVSSYGKLRQPSRLPVSKTNKILDNKTKRNGHHSLSIHDISYQYKQISEEQPNEGKPLTDLEECGNLQKMSQIESDLKSSQIQNRLLQTKYDNLVSKEKMMLESAIGQVEEYSRIIHDLRVQLHELQIAKIKSDQAAAYSKEQIEQIEELTRHNQTLEGRLIELYENPLRQELKNIKINEKIEFVNEIGTMKIKLKEKDYEIASLKSNSNTIHKENLILTARLSELEKVLNKTKSLIDEPLLKILDGVTKHELAKALVIVRNLKQRSPDYKNLPEKDCNQSKEVQGKKIITQKHSERVVKETADSKEVALPSKRYYESVQDAKVDSDDNSDDSDNTNYSIDF